MVQMVLPILVQYRTEFFQYSRPDKFLDALWFDSETSLYQHLHKAAWILIDDQQFLSVDQQDVAPITKNTKTIARSVFSAGLF